MLQIEIIEENLVRNVRNRFPTEGYDSRHFAGLLKSETNRAKSVERAVTNLPNISFATYYSPILSSLAQTFESDLFKEKKPSKASLEKPVLDTHMNYMATGLVYKVEVTSEAQVHPVLSYDGAGCTSCLLVTSGV